VEIGQGGDVLACRGGHQSQPQTKRRHEALTPTKSRLFTTGVQQGLRKHPLELVSHHAKLLVIQLALLWLYLNQQTPLEFRMDRNKSPINQVLKSSNLCTYSSMRAEAYELMHELSDSYWWYCARREIILDIVSRFVSKGSRIIDYGCGNGAIAVRLREAGYDVVAADIDPGPLAACRAAGLKTVDLRQDSLQRGQAQCLLLADVLEHIDDDLGTLVTLRHALCENGHIILTVPAYEFLFSGEDFVSNHVRRYTRKQLIVAIKGAGFSPLWSSYFNFFLFPVIVTNILTKRIFQPRKMYQSNVEPLPCWLNSLLYQVFRLEGPLLRFLRFPLGGSIVAVAQLRQDRIGSVSV
jgi:2-polyprenyl-3-methyl-5-hydroxy-6-metoxy-1,4-benzoquinol methylase